MPAAYQSFAHASASTGANVVVTKPTGTVDGDLLIAVGVSTGNVTAPAGWTTHPNSISAQYPLWTKIASGEGANYTFTQSALQTSKVVIVRINGQASSSPVDVAAGVNGTAALVIPSVTTTGADRLLFQIASHQAAGTWTGPGTQTERFDAQDGGPYAAAGGDEVVGSGATGTRTWTPSVTGSIGVAYMLAIKSGTQTVSPGGVASTSAVGTPTVTPGSVTVSPGGVGSTAAVGSPTVVPGAVTVSPNGIGSTALVGTPTVVPGSFTVSPGGIDSSALLGTPTVTAGGFTVTPTGIAPTSGVGTPTVLTSPTVTATVFDHETGNPVGAGATVQLFNADGTLIDTTVTDVDGVYVFNLPVGFADDVFTVVRLMVGPVEYQGVSEICAVT